MSLYVFCKSTGNSAVKMEEKMPARMASQVTCTCTRDAEISRFSVADKEAESRGTE